jgi:transcription antitermination factor NusB
MRKRTRSREYALQILYQIDITHEEPLSAIEDFWQAHLEEGIDEEMKAFAAEIVKGAVQNLVEIDRKIAQYATNWELERMAVVDRNILRMGGFELLYSSGIPPKVAINEGVDLAKKFSGIEAGKFVNAILDKIKIELEK